MSLQILNRGLAILLLLLVLILLSLSVRAHTLEPSIINLTLSADGNITAEIETDAEAWLSGVLDVVDNEEAPEAQLYEELRRQSVEAISSAFTSRADEFASEFSIIVTDSAASEKNLSMVFESVVVPDVGDTSESRKSLITYQSTLPVSAESLVWRLHEKFGDNVLFVLTEELEQKPMFWLPAGGTSESISIQASVKPRTTAEVISDYLYLGYIHIVPRGLDHILFVLGLFLLSRRFKPLLWQVSAFTLAHTITLAMSSQGIISLSANIVEPLIALSIAYVAIENIFTRDLKSWRVVVVFAFGLLHGLGFAGVLSELGLPDTEFITALIAFNVGVEAGQLSVIAVAFVVVLVLTRILSMSQEHYRKMVVIPASLLIAITGLYWTVERIFL